VYKQKQGKKSNVFFLGSVDLPSSTTHQPGEGKVAEKAKSAPNSSRSEIQVSFLIFISLNKNTVIMNYMPVTGDIFTTDKDTVSFFPYSLGKKTGSSNHITTEVTL
jgi:hypothetical protein